MLLYDTVWQGKWKEKEAPRKKVAEFTFTPEETKMIFTALAGRAMALEDIGQKKPSKEYWALYNKMEESLKEKDEFKYF